MSETIAFGMGLMLGLVLLCGGAYQWGWTRAIAESRKLRHLGVELDDWHDYDEQEHQGLERVTPFAAGGRR